MGDVFFILNSLMSMLERLKRKMAMVFVSFIVGNLIFEEIVWRRPQHVQRSLKYTAACLAYAPKRLFQPNAFVRKVSTSRALFAELSLV